MPTSLNPSTFAQDDPACPLCDGLAVSECIHHDDADQARAANKPLDTGSSPLLHSRSMREATVRLDALPDGAFFRLELAEFDPKLKRSVTTGWTYGQKLWHNNCRVRVLMAGRQRQVAFNDADGNTREFDAAGTVEMSYPTMLEVVRIDDNAAEQTPIGRSDRMDSMDAAQEKALRKRFEFATAAVTKAAGDAAKTEVAQKRLDGIIAEADAAGVSLAGTLTTVTAKGGTTAKTTPAKGADAAAVKALKAKAEPKAPKAPKLPTTQDCLCGCGLETGGKFRPGHDARVKGWLSKVEQGKYEGGFDALPDTLKPHVKMGGSAKTAGTENQTYRILQSPVKFPGRDDIKVI